MIESFLTQYKAQGACVGIVDHNGQWKYKKVYNEAMCPHPVAEQSRYGIASITKLLTAIVMLKGATSNWWSLDDSISDYFPSFDRRDIRIHHFLNHTSGYYPQPRTTIAQVCHKTGFMQKVHDCGLSTEYMDQAVAILIDQLNAEKKQHSYPGTHVSYFNDGFALLGEVIRVASPYVHYEAAIQDLIFKPLGMHDSTTTYLDVNKSDQTTFQYYWNENQCIEIKDYYDNAFALQGGGAAKSTLHDMGKLATWLMQPSNDMLGQLETHLCEVGYGSQYGFGSQYIQTEIGKVVGHAGSLTGVSSALFINETKTEAAIVLCNTSDIPVQKLALMMLNTTTKDTPDEVSWSLEKMDSLCGSYGAGEGYSVEISKESVTIEGENHSYTTCEYDYIRVATGNNPIYLKIIFEEIDVNGIRFGLRILEKTNDKN